MNDAKRKERIADLKYKLSDPDILRFFSESQLQELEAELARLEKGDE